MLLALGTVLVATGLSFPVELDARTGRKIWHSERIEISSAALPLRASIDFVFHGPVGVNGAIDFYGADGRPCGNQFLWPSLKMLPREQWGRRDHHAVTLPYERIPSGAKSASLRIMAGHYGAYGDEPPKFEIFSGGLSFSSMPVAENFANWAVLGESFRFNAVLPAGRTGYVVRIRDTDGREVAAVRSDGARAVWTPTEIGFYTAKSSWLDAAGTEYPCEGLSFSAARHRQEPGGTIIREVFQEFVRDEQSLAVSPERPPAVGEASETFGFNVDPGVADPDSAYRLVGLLGMNSFVRLHHFHWDDIEKSRGAYDWRKVDRAFADAKRNGIGMDRLLVNTFGTPAWASSVLAGLAATVGRDVRYYAPKNMSVWRDYIRAFAARYPDMKYLELWNEPHLPGYSIFWKDSSPAQFVELMKSGYEGAKAANPDLMVLMGGVGMRYQPFYEEYVKLGGVKWFDQVDTHCGYDMQHFRDTEARYGAEAKPYWEGEWHTVLYNCSKKPRPTEEECAAMMLRNMAALLYHGNTRVTGFGLMCGEHTPDSADFFAKAEGIQQVSGLFLSTPILEPRLAALVLRTASDRFRGRIVPLGAWCYSEDGAQRIAAFRSDRGVVGYAWSENGRLTKSGWSAAFRKAVAGRRILDWEGRAVTGVDAMRPQRVYFVLNPDLEALATGVKLDRLGYQAYNYRPDREPARGGYTSGDSPVWNAMKGTNAPPFAATLDAKELRVAFRDIGDLKRAVFALDVEGAGILEDVLELAADRNGEVVKLRAPAIRGDIPSEWSEAGATLRRSQLERVVKDGECLWTLRVAASDLYPFVFAPGKPLRVFLSTTTAAGTTFTWGDGWDEIKKPAEFGVLTPSGGGRLLVDQGKLTPFQDAVLDRGGTLRVKATSDRRGAGVTASVTAVRGSVIKATFSVRGHGRLGTTIWAWAKGTKTTRIDAKPIPLSDDWREQTVRWQLPPHADCANVALFDWKNGAFACELRDLKIVNE